MSPIIPVPLDRSLIRALLTLTGPLPPSLGVSKTRGVVFLTKIKRLAASNNQFSGHLPPSLGKLSTMTSLDLQGNSLTGGGN
jgi:hypothetical protein